MCLCNIPVILARFSKNIQISNFMKIGRVAAELFHAGGWTDIHDETDYILTFWSRNFTFKF